MTPAGPKRNPQTGFDEVTIEDPEFEQALLDYIDQKEQRGIIRDNAAARRSGLKKHKSRLKPGVRARVGSVTFDVIERHGGGFDVGNWTTVSMAGVKQDGTS